MGWRSERERAARTVVYVTAPIPSLRILSYRLVHTSGAGPKIPRERWAAEARNLQGLVHTRFGLRSSPVSHAGRCVRISSESLPWSMTIPGIGRIAATAITALVPARWRASAPGGTSPPGLG